jgi:MHS family proline/betaine transporter-like MFS transporter
MSNVLSRPLIASLSGTILQWYDFSLFACVAPILAKTFFPEQNHFLALINVFVIFAVGYLAAPLGSLFFGHIGDRFGRKFTLSLSILLMTIPTALIALIPSYREIGILAPIMLAICRLIQGFVASAEFTGAAIFLLEHTPANRRAWASGWTGTALNSGLILGTLISSIATLSFMPTWAWRIPFLFAALGALVVYYLRQRVAESPEFAAVENEQQLVDYPLLESFKHNRRSLWHVLGLGCAGGTIVAICYFYMPTYISQVGGLSLSTGLWIVSLGLTVDAIMEPFAGKIADKIGHTKHMIIGSMIVIACILPLFYELSSGNLWRTALFMVLTSSIVGCTFAPINAVLIALFPVQNRFSGVSVIYHVGWSLFVAPAPLLCTYLSHLHNGRFAPAIYVMLGALLGIITLKSIGNKKAARIIKDSPTLLRE